MQCSVAEPQSRSPKGQTHTILKLCLLQYPDSMGAVARTVVNWVTVPVAYALDKAEHLLPSSILNVVAKI